MERLEIRGARLSPQGWLMFVLVASFFLAPAVVATIYEPKAQLFLMLFSGGAMLLAWNRLYRPQTRGAEAALCADAHELRFGELRVPTGSIRRVRVTPQGSGARVRVDLGVVRPPLWFEIPTVADARALATALGHDVARTRERFEAYLPPAASFVMIVAFQVVLNFGLRHAGWREWMAAGAGAMVFVIAARHRYIEIGPDGVFVRKPFGRTHLPASELHAVRRGAEKRGQCQLVFAAGYRTVTVWVSEGQVSAIESRVAELIAARKERSTTNGETFLDRSVPELRAFGAQPATFRAEGIDRDALLGIVENVHLAPGVRARAAVALPVDDPEARARVRIIAANVTLPELRIALDRSAQDDAAVEEALEDLERAVARFRRR